LVVNAARVQGRIGEREVRVGGLDEGVRVAGRPGADHVAARRQHGDDVTGQTQGVEGRRADLAAVDLVGAGATGARVGAVAGDDDVVAAAAVNDVAAVAAG